MKRLIRLSLPFIAGLILVVVLFSAQSISLDDLFARPIIWSYVIAVLALSFLYILLGALKWKMISQQWQGQSGSLAQYINHTAQMMLISQFLPLSLATTIHRASVLKSEDDLPLKKGIAHALYDLGFDFSIALLLVPASLYVLMVDNSFAAWGGLGFFCLLTGLAFLWATPSLLRKIPLFRSWSDHGLLERKFMAQQFGLSLLRFLVISLRLCVGATALGFAISWSVLTEVAPLATIPALLPLTPANLGIAEWSWAYLLELWRIPLETGALYAATFRLLTFFAHFLLALPCFFKKPR